MGLEVAWWFDEAYLDPLVPRKNEVNALEEKYRRLREIVRRCGTLVVAFSGGIDSALVLKVARDVLGDRAVAVTSDSPSVPRRELEEAKRLAREIGVRHVVVKTGELENEDYARNPVDRCYFCKTELYTHCLEVAEREGVRFIANGTNTDDLGDYRPGLQAADEFEIVSPLRDAGLDKEEVRVLARRLGLDVWDKPASPCLASRIPYGSEVTAEKLAAVEQAEDFLRGLGLREVRVRHFGALARIEVPARDLEVVENHLADIRKRFAPLGFIDIELREFKSGSLNALIHAQKEH